MDIINLNDRKNKLKPTSSIPTFKVKINYFNVKYLESAPGGRTRVHFIDKTSLLINRPLDQASKAMDQALSKKQ